MFSNSNSWVNYAYLCISGFGFAANFKGYKYITRTFNVNDNLFNILAKDALITTVLNGLYSIGSFIMITNRDVLKGRIACASLILIGFLPMVTGPFVSFVISLRRFIGMKYPDLLKQNSFIANIGNPLIILFVIAYYVILVYLSTFRDWRAFNFVQLCLDQPEGKSGLIMILTVIIPNMVLIGITIALDYATKVKINQVEDEVRAELKSIVTERKRRDEIAKRAMIINAGLFLPWVFYSVIIGKGLDISLETQVICMTIPNLLVDALRNPIIARFAFRVNRAIHNETVEDRRQEVIELALKKREEAKGRNKAISGSLQRVEQFRSGLPCQYNSDAAK